MPKSILTIEDEKNIQNILKAFLEDAGYNITLAGDGMAGIATFHKTYYDLVLLDIMMPGLDGFAFCSQIRSYVDCPIIFLTAKIQEADIVRGLGLGADDYITKPFGTDELRARVNAHLRRDSREKKNAFSISGIVFQISAKEAEFQGKKLPLTKSEYEICEYLALHHGQTFTREQIYEAVFGLDGESDSSVISTHIKNIRSKLTAYQLAPIETVWGVGYKWV